MIQASPVLAPWANYYVILGSAAAGLTGLTFVVITLLMNTNSLRSRMGLAIFTTPTVIHFAGVVFIAAMVSAPWKLLVCPAVGIAISALLGVAYIMRQLITAIRFDDYEPDAEDWTWYFGLPLLAYGALVAGSVMLLWVSGTAMFVIAGGGLLLIFIGIHNAWDITTYIAVRDAEAKKDQN